MTNLIKAIDNITPKCDGVYIIYNNTKDKAYVGSTNDLNNRVKHHEKDLIRNNHFNRGLQKAFNDNDLLNLVILPLENRDDAFTLEQKIIDKFISAGTLYNVSRNARYCNVAVSNETKEKQRQAHLGKVLSDEQKNKISLATKGKIVSEETREKQKK